ncbi:MAG: hypothetical protein JW791_03870 [Nanoarchaeota archaeon]|nr:hypothetical protein [Nanoarchaeota archaeon]
MAKKKDLNHLISNQADVFIIISVALGIITLIVIMALLMLSTGSTINQVYYCTSDDTGNTMSIEQAVNLMKLGECAGAKMNGDYYCNSFTGTWWIDIETVNTPSGCNPACVVSVDTGETSINWRCTGLI